MNWIIIAVAVGFVIFFLLSIIFHFFRFFTESIVRILIFGTVITSLLAAIAVHDAKQIQERLPEERVLFVLERDDQAVAAFVMHGKREPNVYKETQLRSVSEAFAADDLESVGARYYKTIVVQRSYLDGLNITQQIDSNLNSEQALRLLDSQDPIGDIAERIATEQEVPVEMMLSSVVEHYGTNATVKALIFQLYVVEIMNPQVLLRSQALRIGEVVMHPETAMIKAIKYLPPSVAEWALRSR